MTYNIDDGSPGTVTIYLLGPHGGLAQELTTKEAEKLAKKLQEAIDKSKEYGMTVDVGAVVEK